MSVVAHELWIEADEARAEALRTGLLRGALAVGLGLILLPLVIVVVYSLSSVAYGVFPPPGFSWRWYVNLAQQAAFRGAFLRSVGVGVTSTALALVVGSLGSLALVRAKFPGRELLRAFLLSPIVMPKIVLGVGWFIFFARLGLQGGVVPLILAHTVVVLPFVITILAANLVGLDPSLEEAAQDLGASPPMVFWRIVLPQIRAGHQRAIGFRRFLRSGREFNLSRPGRKQYPPNRDVPLHGEVAGSHDCRALDPAHSLRSASDRRRGANHAGPRRAADFPPVEVHA